MNNLASHIKPNQSVTAHIKPNQSVTAHIKPNQSVIAKIKAVGQSDQRIDYQTIDFTTLIKLQTGIIYENTN